MNKENENVPVVLITGASSGIGKALALHYAAKGFRLSLCARRIEKLQELEKTLLVETLSTRTDISQEEECRILIEKTVAHFGRIDILINNAGMSMRAAFLQTNTEVFRQVMQANFWGTVYCTRYALPYLLKTQGSLVGIISIAGYVGLPGRAAYSASKFAVRGFLDTLRIETRNTGVHVLVAAPGFTASEIRQKALTGGGNQQGESPRDEEKMMSAEECAYRIAKAIKKRKRTLILTWKEGKLTVWLSKHFPILLDRMIFNHMKKESNSPF